MALKDTKPSERGKINESPAKTKQFSHISLPSHLGIGARETADDEAARTANGRHVQRGVVTLGRPTLPLA